MRDPKTGCSVWRGRNVGFRRPQENVVRVGGHETSRVCGGSQLTGAGIVGESAGESATHDLLIWKSPVCGLVGGRGGDTGRIGRAGLVVISVVSEAGRDVAALANPISFL